MYNVLAESPRWVKLRVEVFVELFPAGVFVFGGTFVCVGGFDLAGAVVGVSVFAGAVVVAIVCVGDGL